MPGTVLVRLSIIEAFPPQNFLGGARGEQEGEVCSLPCMTVVCQTIDPHMPSMPERSTLGCLPTRQTWLHPESNDSGAVFSQKNKHILEMLWKFV